MSSDVGKDGFGYREALRVNLAPQFAINLAGHPPGKVGEFNPNRYPQIFSFAPFVSDTAQLQRATPTILFLSHIYSVHQIISTSFFRYPPESIALRAPVVVGGLLVMKII